MMQLTTSGLNEAIGQRVRRERLERRWTLDQLAHAAGVSRRQLINIEQGEANPSISTLLGISDALGIGLPSLVAPPTEEAVAITPRGEGAELWSSEAGGSARLVAGSEPPDVLELWDWTLAAGDDHVSVPHAAGTRELLQVLEGSVVLEVAGTRHVLATGDAASFRGDVAHAYRNHGDSTARFSLAVFEPSVTAPSPRQETP